MNIPLIQRDSPLILVVDDDKFMRIQLRHAMEEAGYQVVEASDGEQGLAVYTRVQPDIVLLDALMPVMDGFTCCNLLRAYPVSDRTASSSVAATLIPTPVLMITALEDQESVDQAFEAGATDYITKPIHWAVLRQRVHRLLEATRATAQLRQQTERAQLSEEQLRLALEAAHMGTWDWDILGGKVSHSVTTEALHGLPPGSFDGTYKSFIRSLHPEDQELVTQAVHRTLEEGADYNIEFRVIWPDGSVHWVVSKGQVYYDSSGKAVRMTGINMDMTKRKQAEEALRESEARLRLALEAAHTGIWDWNIPLNKVTWSDNFERLFGLETGSFGRTYQAFLECVHSEDREFVAQSVKSAVEEGANHEIEFRIVWPDGSVRWMVGQGRVFYDETGKAVRMLGTTIDITERKRAEEERVQLLEREQIARAESEAARNAAEEAQKRITNILGSITDAFFALDNQWRFTYLNRQAEQLLQRTHKELLSKNLWDEFPEAVGSVLFEQYHKAVSEQVSVEFEAFYPPLNRWFDVHAYPARDGVSVYFQDITDRKQAEEALRQSEERFQIVARATNDAIWDWNLLTNELWWNEGVQTLFGYLAEEVGLGISWWYEQIHPEDRERVVSEIHAVINKGRQFWSHEYRFRRNDGSYAYIFDRGYLVHDNKGNPGRMIGAMMDITDRKRAQEELQRQTMRSQLFAEVTLKIRQSLQIEEILQTTVTEVHRILKADRVLIFQLWSNGFGKIVTEAVNPNWSSVLGENITDDYFESEYLNRYSQGRIYTIADIETAKIPDCLIEFMQDFKVKAKLAVPIFLKEKLWGLLVAHQCEHPRQWSSFETELMGQLAAQIGIALAQAQLLEQETRQRQELLRSNTELQQFASIASHDLQEPLRKIQAFGNRLKDKYSEALTDQGCDYLDRMQNAAQRMQTLIDDLLILSRVTTKAQPFVPVNLSQVTQEVLSDLEVCIQQSRGRVEVGELPIIDADPLQMRQLLQNLISNAMKFHRNEELPVVKIYSQLLENQEDHPTGGLTAAEFCQIIVEDNGIGFDEKYLDRIFNVFQRLHTRSEYQGTGVGLAICRKIAERHEGSITAESTLGVGSKFIVTLPIKQRRGENPE